MSQTNAPIPVAVIGVGRMGRHHARVYHELPGTELLAVVDADEDRAETLADQHRCEALPSVDELLEKFPQVKAVSIAVPTVHHGAVAEPLIRKGIACLIEKPLASSSAEAEKIAELAESCGTLVQVGHTERFNPAVRAVLALGVTPRFIEVDRVSPMTFRSLDIGVVMDMMIHDLDIVLTLANSPIKKVDAAGVSVLAENEDIANARLVFANGCVANLTGSRLALKTERKLRLFSDTAYVSLDYHRRTGIMIRKSENETALQEVREQVMAGADLTDVDYSDLVNVDELEMDSANDGQDPLTAELTSFLDAVKAGGPAAVDARAGLAAIHAAEQVVQAIKQHQWEGLAESPV